MRHFLSQDAGSLPDPVRLRVDRFCDHFQAAWRTGRRPRIEEYLANTRERPLLLRELLALEVAYRRRAGERPTEEEYRRRFPGDGTLIRSAFRAALPAAGPALWPGPDGPAGARLPAGGRAREQTASADGRALADRIPDTRRDVPPAADGPGAGAATSLGSRFRVLRPH